MGMVDLVIVDIPENLPMPNVSKPTCSVPSQNALDIDFLGEFFDFADEIIHDDGALLLFHPYNNGDFRESFQDHLLAFGFTILKEWLEDMAMVLAAQPSPTEASTPSPRYVAPCHRLF